MHLRILLSFALVVGLGSASLAQDFLVNGDFSEPMGAKAKIVINGDVADGDTVELDTTGVNRIYEFDIGDGLTVGDVAVDVSEDVTAETAQAALLDAIDGDASAPCFADWLPPAGPIRPYGEILLTWKVSGGLGATNTNDVDANDHITVTDFGDPACIWDFQPVTGWEGLSTRNADVFIPTCPRDPGGDNNTAYASIAFTGMGSGSFYQIVDGLSAGTTYEFRGYWVLGHSGKSGQTKATATLMDGGLIFGSVVDEYQTTIQFGQSPDWQPFSISGTATGTRMTVILDVESGGDIRVAALHVAGCSLTEATCTASPRFADQTVIAPITPKDGVRNTNPLSVTINGENFVPGNTEVRLTQPGQTDIVATNISVDGSGESLTCDVDLTDAPVGSWTVMLTVPGSGCPEAVLANGFRVIADEFLNGGFELPVIPGGPPAGPVPGVPDGWLFNEFAGYGYGTAIYRNVDVYDPGSPIEGDYYGSSTSLTDGSASAGVNIYQTVQATESTNYTFSGFFAGGGGNTVSLELRKGWIDGGLFAPALEIYDGTEGSYGWRFGSVDWTSNSGTTQISAMWTILPNFFDGDPPHAAHADDLRFGVCDTPPTVDGTISPSSGNPGDSVNIVSLPGSGFAGTPQVFLQNADKTRLIFADNVTVSGTNDNITCTIDLVGAPAGLYDVIIRQDVCVVDDQLIGAFEVVELVCPDPFADGDEDMDIDADDFAILQRCLSGTDPTPAGCECWDREPNGVVDLADVVAFEDCVTGPGITVDPEDPGTWPAGCEQ